MRPLSTLHRKGGARGLLERGDAQRGRWVDTILCLVLEGCLGLVQAEAAADEIGEALSLRPKTILFSGSGGKSHPTAEKTIANIDELAMLTGLGPVIGRQRNVERAGVDDAMRRVVRPGRDISGLEIVCDCHVVER